MNIAIRKRSELSLNELRDIAARITIHDYCGNRIREISENGCRWVVLVDVLRAMGYAAKPSNVAKRLQEDEVALKDIGAKSAMVNCVNKAGLFSFAIYSNDNRALDLYTWAKEKIWAE